jgi:HK97 family phage prohead protease
MDNLEVKATQASFNVTDAGEIVGNAWPFGSADSVGDIITKGAFNFIGADLPVLFGHNPDDLIGTWTETAETAEGLVVKGKLHMDQPRARTVLRMIKNKLIGGLSIGFKTKAAVQQGRNRVILALDLYEISVVRNPSHPRARILSAKSELSAETIAVAEAINRATAAQIIKRYTHQ